MNLIKVVNGFYIASILMLFLAIIAALRLPSDNFLIVPGLIVARKTMVLAICGIGVMFVINYAVSAWIYGRNKLIPVILAVSMAIVSAMALLKVASICGFC